MLAKKALRYYVYPTIVLLALFLSYQYVRHQGASATSFKENMMAKPLPDFSAYTDVKEKKQAFFSFLKPIIDAENQRILAIREEVKALYQQLLVAKPFSRSQQARLEKLAFRYDVEGLSSNDPEFFKLLLKRVDTVPASLALAQAANESAWGTSRFARKANNLYGQWCFKAGCGLVPKQRSSGEVHEVASFASPRASVRSYIHNINTSHAYVDLRAMRQKQRQSQAKLSGYQLAEGLLKYSQRGKAYIEELRAMMRVNKLSQYERF